MVAPLLKLLRLTDKEGSTIGLVHEFIDNMIEQIGAMEGISEDK